MSDLNPLHRGYKGLPEQESDTRKNRKVYVSEPFLYDKRAAIRNGYTSISKALQYLFQKSDQLVRFYPTL